MDIAELAKAHGASSLRFFAPLRPLRRIGPVGFTSSDDETTVVECIADESRFNRKLAEGYKMVLIPVDESLRDVYAYEDFYQIDFENLARRNPDSYRVVVNFEGDTH